MTFFVTGRRIGCSLTLMIWILLWSKRWAGTIVMGPHQVVVEEMQWR
jgi:hypothetical protein